jgi:hypothetical protein
MMTIINIYRKLIKHYILLIFLYEKYEFNNVELKTTKPVYY